MGAHGNQVATLILDPFNDLVRWFPVGEFGLSGNVRGLQLGLNFAEIGGVVDNFLADRVRTIGSGSPSVGNMEQNQAAVGELSQLLYVFNDGPVGCGAIEGDKYFVVHGFLFGSPEGAASLSRILRQGGDFDFPQHNGLSGDPSSSTPTDQLPGGSQRVGQPIDVHESDQDSTGPSGRQQEESVLPFAHPLLGAGEVEQWEHGEWKLKCQYDLTQSEQIGDAVVAAQTNDQYCRQDRERASDESAHPRLDPPVHETFHDNLAGQGAGDGTALAGGQQRNGEKCAGGGCSEQRGKCQVGDPDPVAFGAEGDELATRDRDAGLAEEHDGRENHDGRIDEEGHRQCDSGVEGVELQGSSDGRIIFLQATALHEGRVEIEIVGHHGSANDPDCDVEHAGLAEAGTQKRLPEFQKTRPRLRKNKDLDEVAGANRCDQ